MTPPTLAAVVLFLASGCGFGDSVTGAQGGDSVPTNGGSSSVEVVPSSGDVAPRAVGRLDVDGVSPASAPLVLSEYLNSVQLAVRQDVGDDVFGGAVATDADTNDMRITIYGTDADRITAAVDQVAADARDRITVAESRYSVSELEHFSGEAQRRLDVEGIDAYVGVSWGLDAVGVNLVTSDGTPDPTVESAAMAALGDVPVVISFSRPLVRVADPYPDDGSASTASANQPSGSSNTAAEAVRDEIVAMLVNGGWTDIGGDHDISGSATFGVGRPDGTSITGLVLLGATRPVGDTPITSTAIVAGRELVVLGEQAAFAACGEVGITITADTFDQSSGTLTSALDQLGC